MSLTVTFLDAKRTATQKPNPAYPEGMDLDLRKVPGAPYCGYSVPYPAPNCGSYVVECDKCGLRVAFTVAGRADDPRRVVLPCKANA